MISGKTRLMIESTVRSIAKGNTKRVWTDPLHRNGKLVGRSIKYSGLMANQKQVAAIQRKLAALHPKHTFEVSLTENVGHTAKGVNYRGLRVAVRKG